MKMKTNEIKKGVRVQLKNGWFGTMYDNARGNTRMVEVEGYFTEIGSVYAWDIVCVVDHENRPMADIELTDKQLVSRNTVRKVWGE